MPYLPGTAWRLRLRSRAVDLWVWGDGDLVEAVKGCYCDVDAGRRSLRCGQPRMK